MCSLAFRGNVIASSYILVLWESDASLHLHAHEPGGVARAGGSSQKQ